MRVARAAVVAVLSCGLACGVATAALAVDQPISGVKLQLKKKNGKERLLFISKDPGFLFPTIGGPDDPQAVGALVEIVAQPSSVGTLSLPAIVGKEGWTAKPGTVPSYKFNNKLAPEGISPVRATLLKQGKQIKIFAKSLGGTTLSSAVSAAAIRITIGGQRNCAVFDAALVKRSDEEMFLATSSSASAIADCSDESIGVPPPCNSSPYPTCGGACYGDGECTADFASCHCVSPSMPCGDTSPTCNGTCAAGEECAAVGSDFPSCVCIPTGSTPCGSPGPPVCGGVCPSGSVCRPAYEPPSLGGDLDCVCGPPGECGASSGNDCPPGFACAILPPSGDRLCAPMTCGGTYPTCGGACGDGGECDAFNYPDTSYTACVCAPAAPCDSACGGYSCPGGQVCTVTSGFASCSCQ